MEYRHRRKMQMFNEYLFKKKPTCTMYEIKFRADDEEDNKEVENILKNTKPQPAINRYNYIVDKLKRRINTERSPVYCIDDVPYSAYSHRKLTQEIENSKVCTEYVPTTPNSQHAQSPRYFLSSSVIELPQLKDEMFFTQVQ